MSIISCVGESPKSSLCTVVIVDPDGLEYSIPLVNAEKVKRVLPESGRIPEGQTSLVIVNAMAAVVSIPLMCVKEVRLAGEVVWSAP